MATVPRPGLRYTAFITAVQIVASFLLVWLLLGQGQTFFATIVVLFYLVALWRHPRVASLGHPSASALVVGLWGVGLYIVFFLMGQLAGAPGMGPGPNPPMLIPFFILGLWLYGLGHISYGRWGGRGLGVYLVLVFIIVVTGIPGGPGGVGQLLLGGSWGNAGGLVGEAGFAIESALETELLEPIGDTYEYTTNRLLNPSRNRNLAQLACAGRLLAGGGVFEVASGSASMSQCVEDMLAQNETQARSEQVTSPVELQLEDPRIEPFDDHVRVGVPVTNTIVYDLAGVPINIPARDVTVTVTWTYLDKEMISIDRTIPEIPNGDTRLVEFDERGDGTSYFKTFPILMSTTDQELATNVVDLVEEDSSRTADWFITRFEDQDLSRERIVFIIQNTGLWDIGDANPDAVSCENPGSSEMETLCNDLEREVGLDPVLPQGRDYSVQVNVSYDYQAEAAFTESSRWRSGNQLLEVWTEEAWQELPLSERDAWRQTKCGSITKYGQEFTKQRTAALTTPVVPVMYTDCGISLFRGIEQGEDHTLDIEIGVNVNGESDSSDLLDESGGFRIRDAETTCGTGSDVQSLVDNDDLSNSMTSDWFSHAEGVGWSTGDSDIATVERTLTVQGQRQSVACRTRMNLTLNMMDDTSYTIPDIG